MTEFSIGINIDDKEIDIPMLVPGLTDDELKYLLSEPSIDQIPETIKRKAVEHAFKQLREGKSVFK